MERNKQELEELTYYQSQHDKSNTMYVTAIPDRYRNTILNSMDDDAHVDGPSDNASINIYRHVTRPRTTSIQFNECNVGAGLKRVLTGSHLSSVEQK